jgi:hypothetical protein
MGFLGKVIDFHPQQELVGYRRGAEHVDAQVEAIFNALRHEAKIRYVTSIIAFSPDDGLSTQRVRLPRESLKHGVANCIDATVLFASLLEAASLSPAIVVIPGHAFLAWETDRDSDEWRYLEVTTIGTQPYDQGRRMGEMLAARYHVGDEQNEPADVNRWPLRMLRGVHKVMPLE